MTNAPREVAETALGHRVGNVVEQAYARSDLFEKRQALMESWARYLDNAPGMLLNCPGWHDSRHRQACNRTAQCTSCGR